MQPYSEEVSALKIRIKFAKRGSLKFVGHLDIMRYFQKLIRRADIDIAYSEGFNPHQKMSFAQPLGVGMLSEGEYVDIEVNTTLSSADAISRLNAANVEDLEILSYRALRDSSSNAMSSVAAADYRIEYRDGYKPDNFNFVEAFDTFYNTSDTVSVIKETKKSQTELDIKPFIYKYSGDGDALCVQLSAGSVTNIKPELLMEAFYRHLGLTPADFTFIYTRLEVYGYDENGCLVPLESFGDVV